MEAVIKIITNSEDIAAAKNYNLQQKVEYAGHRSYPQVQVPKPVYDTQKYSFRLDLVNSFYVEKNTVEGNEEGDVIVNITYEGLVRFQYDPLLISRLDLYLNVK